ncbi:hypothetical protein [Jatrophihabitans sp.]|uniref:hypothetical protein n=1 Tax=Jatrophihabitans sp. TaxID=1932789 RepID=UPI0030C6D9E6|nr:hypothetical protein [Jatrophihabitans sp.]
MALVNITITRRSATTEATPDAPRARRWRRRAAAAAAVVAVVGVAGGIAEATGDSSSPPSSYTAVTPAVLTSATMAASATKDIVVAGTAGVPAGATSVQLSVTVAQGSVAGDLFVYPTGAAQPSSANVHWLAGEAVTIPVTSQVGTAGKVRLHNGLGSALVKVSVVGYYAALPTSGVAVNDANGALLGTLVDVDPAGSGVTVLTPNGYLVTVNWDGTFPPAQLYYQGTGSVPCSGAAFLSDGGVYGSVRSTFLLNWSAALGTLLAPVGTNNLSTSGEAGGITGLENQGCDTTQPTYETGWQMTAITPATAGLPAQASRGSVAGPIALSN